MKERMIVIEIDGEGRLSANAEGFEGDACIKDLERLLEGVGGYWETVERKPEATEGRLARRRATTVKKRSRR